MIKFEDLDEAIIGIKEDLFTHTKRYIYDYEKCIETLMSKGDTEQEAIDWIDYNVLGSYYGKETPIILRKNND